MKNVLMLLVVATLLVSVSIVMADVKPTAPTTSPTTQSATGKITKIADGKVTLTNDGKDGKSVDIVYLTTDKTEVTVDGKAAKLADLKTGMMATITFTVDKDVRTATKIAVVTKPSATGKG
jgi:hypothetical protein